jgi:hypothetical protein
LKPTTYVSRISVALLFVMASGIHAGCRPKKCDCKHAASPEPVSGPDIEGMYVVNGNPKDKVVIKRLSKNRYRLTTPGWWEGVGIFDGKMYYGVYRYHDDRGQWAGVWGTHHARFMPDGSFVVQGKNTIKRTGEFESVWTRASRSKKGAP